jgi:hypothetical protein
MINQNIQGPGPLKDRVFNLLLYTNDLQKPGLSGDRQGFILVFHKAPEVQESCTFADNL